MPATDRRDDRRCSASCSRSCSEPWSARPTRSTPPRRSELETLAAPHDPARRHAPGLCPEADPAAWDSEGDPGSYAKIWGGADAGAARRRRKSVDGWNENARRVSHVADAENGCAKQVLATATAAAAQIAQTRVMMILQLAAGINWPLLAIVVAWSVLLFCGYGLVSPAQRHGVDSACYGRDRDRQRAPAHHRAVASLRGRFQDPFRRGRQAIQALGACERGNARIIGE